MISIIVFTLLAFFLLEVYANKPCCAGVKIDHKKLIIITITITALYYIIKTYL